MKTMEIESAALQSIQASDSPTSTTTNVAASSSSAECKDAADGDSGSDQGDSLNDCLFKGFSTEVPKHGEYIAHVSSFQLIRSSVGTFRLPHEVHSECNHEFRMHDTDAEVPSRWIIEAASNCLLCDKPRIVVRDMWDPGTVLCNGDTRTDGGGAYKPHLPHYLLDEWTPTPRQRWKQGASQ